MRRASFENLLTAVRHCAEYAVHSQKDINRSYKDDGSVLTETDLYISNYLINTIKSDFPDCSIISEEEKTEKIEGSPYIFVIDPIDGTDVYSQGMPSWCIAIGILDSELEPVGSIISAPRWGIGTPDGLLLSLFPGDETPLINGEPLSVEGKDFNQVSQIISCSGSFKTLDFSRLKGKLRSFGSNILHIIAPAVYRHIQGTIFASCFIWDIAASHAIIKSLGLEIQYIDGKPFSYSEDLLSRRTSAGYAFVSTPSGIEEMHKRISLR